MRSPLSRRVLFATIVSVVLLAMHARAASKPTPFATLSVRGPFKANNHEQLYCDSSYSLPECSKQIQILKQALEVYPAALLPSWKWVLVRAERWKPLAKSLHLDPDSPAVTLLDDDTILLEESLIVPRADRAAELMNSYTIALDQLLDVAISHELGHAICHEQNEFRADAIGRDLRKQIAAGGPVNVTCVRPVIPSVREGR
jgi:hypothetical protein